MKLGYKVYGDFYTKDKSEESEEEANGLQYEKGTLWRGILSSFRGHVCATLMLLWHEKTCETAFSFPEILNLCISNM
jgi:hypothetical protein